MTIFPRFCPLSSPYSYFIRQYLKEALGLLPGKGRCSMGTFDVFGFFSAKLTQ
jgi:hypothetical protein